MKIAIGKHLHLKTAAAALVLGIAFTGQGTAYGGATETKVEWYHQGV